MPHIVVVGGGVAGLAAAWRLTREGAGVRSGGSDGSGEPAGSGGPDGVRVTLVEASPRFGGKIVTERVDGFLIEGGADSFAARKPRGVGLVRELGLEGRLIPTGRSGPAGVYLALGDRLVPLPEGLSLVVPTRVAPVLRSPLLSVWGKLRVGMDLVLPRRRVSDVESAGPGEEGRRALAHRFGRHGDRPLHEEEGAAGGDREGRWAGARHFGRHGDRPLRSGGSEEPVVEPSTLLDESVADFVRRRFGGEYLERVAGPLLGGIHSTDPEDLSIEAAFPHLAALERRHRSLLLGVRRMNGAGAPPGRPGSSAGSSGAPGTRDTAAARVSLAGGMGELVDALVAGLREAGVELLAGCPVAGLEAASGAGAPLDAGSASGASPGGRSAWTVRLADGRSIAADAVVLATPPPVTAGLLGGLEGANGPAGAHLASTVRQIPQVSTATVSLGLPRAALGRELLGMGFLVPRSEGRLVSACTFSSLKFPGRAPEGHVLLRAFVAGSGGFPAGVSTSEAIASDDEALTRRVRTELAEILGLADGPGAEPVVTRVHRFAEANPQYRVGHAERVRALEAALPPGLALAGCGFHGLGIPDCVASGERAARAALQAAVA